ncbi:hypothetical protein CS063_16230 [Sporanaerobium hydrogeniformans]|uniref:Uncharacterized protein n=1 Tax=Sporanaerobium hydrogeniformans TaxID=3072179 RepID=A0AC61D9S5_9FIRM|nr:substrate-binding domain-containing protein [Sporanaerobium hydrogeniformans]PHV69337.1 hypothetical protein CS063_16230 [Sporanaerobium hydrogeniformans]
MKNKVKALLLISLIGGFTFVGYFSLKKKEIPQKKVIAVSMIGETHDWPVGVAYYAQQEVKEVAQQNNWEYKFIISADTNEQSAQLIELVEEKVDCIVMLPMDGASLKTAAMIIKDAGIPLVIFDREIPDFAPTATVKGDNKGIGIKTADLFNGYFPDGTKVLEFMGDTSTVPQQRTDGYDETINNNFKKEQVGYTGWQREDSKQLLQHWVRDHSEQEIDGVGAIFTHDDEIALGILDALDEYSIKNDGNKKFKNLKVIAGSAGSKEMYHRIQNEKQYILFSLTYSPTMIKKAIRIGEKIIKGEDYEEVTIIETEEVNKYNVLEYLNENSPY